ncbi:hypothetical protein [Actinomadura harenae]|uniref:hypothetical protein n=1 Tax=Actinomadura harenae TaxID=2483351 RepID=UPI0011C38E93|nr:hypothetical protein [Actinomadura harenae]
MNISARAGGLASGLTIALLTASIAAPANANPQDPGLDLDKLHRCFTQLKATYEQLNGQEAAAQTALQRWGSMVNPDGAFNENNAKNKLANCGVPKTLYRVAINFLEEKCAPNGKKGALKKAKTAEDWEKIVPCLVEQGNALQA